VDLIILPAVSLSILLPFAQAVPSAGATQPTSTALPRFERAACPVFIEYARRSGQDTSTASECGFERY
jgi:hypothetical protein